jgi:hypothetical protein
MKTTTEYLCDDTVFPETWYELYASWGHQARFVMIPVIVC